MKYCRHCKVNVFEGHRNCPLCGGALDENPAEQNDYRESIEPYIAYPKLAVEGQFYRELLSAKAFLALLIVTAICIVINSVLYPDRAWSGYVAVGCAIAYACVLPTVYRHRRLYAQIAIDAFILPAAAFACDMFHSFDRSGSVSALFGLSLEYIVPAFLAAAIIVTDVMAFVDREGKYYFVTLWFVCLMATVPQIVVWATGRFVWHLTLPLFIFALADAAVLSAFCWKQFRDELKRKFFI